MGGIFQSGPSHVFRAPETGRWKMQAAGWGNEAYWSITWTSACDWQDLNWARLPEKPSKTQTALFPDTKCCWGMGGEVVSNQMGPNPSLVDLWRANKGAKVLTLAVEFWDFSDAEDSFMSRETWMMCLLSFCHFVMTRAIKHYMIAAIKKCLRLAGVYVATIHPDNKEKRNSTKRRGGRLLATLKIRRMWTHSCHFVKCRLLAA